MHHFKCAACRTRLHSASDLTDLTGGTCPRCGALLSPASDLSELVGYRAIGHDDARHAPGADEVAPVADLFARRASHEQARLDFERWGDEGDMAEAVSMPWPERS